MGMKDVERMTIPIPGWVKLRLSSWKFAGWISRNPVLGLDFDELVRNSLRSDHGEIREVDYYDEGAAIWWKETSQ